MPRIEVRIAICPIIQKILGRERGEIVVDSNIFRQAWGKYPTGVAVVTSIESDGHVHGMEVVSPQKLGIHCIWVDHRDEGLPEQSPARPNRIVRAISELV